MLLGTCHVPGTVLSMLPLIYVIKSLIYSSPEPWVVMGGGITLYRGAVPPGHTPGRPPAPAASPDDNSASSAVHSAAYYSESRGCVARIRITGLQGWVKVTLRFWGLGASEPPTAPRTRPWL